MSTSFEDADVRSFSMSYWNWGVLRNLRGMERGGRLEAAPLAELVEFLKTDLLPRIPPHHRMFLDGSTTDVPDDNTLYRGDKEFMNYCLPHDVLVAFIAFLEAATAPLTFY